MSNVELLNTEQILIVYSMIVNVFSFEKLSLEHLNILNGRRKYYG
jgi:hypothetical protein